MAFNRQLKIFLADESLFCLKMYELHLNVVGYKNLTLYEDREACIRDLGQLPDVVFLGQGSDAEIGLNILQQIKRFDHSIYVVFMMGEENTGTAQASLEKGAFDYIIKGESDLERMKELLLKIGGLKEIFQ